MMKKINTDPAMMDKVADLRAEIDRLQAENDVLHKTDKWRYENVLRMKAEIDRLQAELNLYQRKWAPYTEDQTDPPHGAPAQKQK